MLTLLRYYVSTSSNLLFIVEFYVFEFLGNAKCAFCIDFHNNSIYSLSYTDCRMIAIIGKFTHTVVIYV